MNPLRPHPRHLLDAALDRPLRPGEQETLDRHLAGCIECQAHARTLAQLHADLSRTMPTLWAWPNAAYRDTSETKARISHAIKRARWLRPIRQGALSLAASGMVILAVLYGARQLGLLERDNPGIPATILETAAAAPHVTAPAQVESTPQAPGPTPTQDALLVQHEVREEDTCIRIALAYGISVSNLIAASGLDENCTISVGQTLQIPLPNPSQTLATTEGQHVWQTADLNCDGQPEQVLVQPHPSAPANYAAVVLADNRGSVLLAMSAAKVSADHLTPELITVGECYPLLAIGAVKPRGAGNYVYIFRWDGLTATSVLDAPGRPFSDDGLVGSLAQTPRAPFRITLLRQEGPAEKCRTIHTDYEWTEETFVRVDVREFQGCGNGG